MAQDNVPIRSLESQAKIYDAKLFPLTFIVRFYVAWQIFYFKLRGLDNRNCFVLYWVPHLTSKINFLSDLSSSNESLKFKGNKTNSSLYLILYQIKVRKYHIKSLSKAISRNKNYLLTNIFIVIKKLKHLINTSYEC